MDVDTTTLLYKKIVGLAALSATSITKLFEAASVRHLAKGERFLKQGQVCRSIVFVEKGYLRTFLNKDGIDINTDFTFENNFTTNLKSLRLAAPSEMTICAGEATTLYEFNKDALLQLYTVSPEIESFGRKLLEQLLIAQEEHTNLFKLCSPTERYHYIQAHMPQLLQRVSLSQAASYLGVARETVSRIRKKR